MREDVEIINEERRHPELTTRLILEVLLDIRTMLAELGPIVQDIYVKGLRR